MGLPSSTRADLISALTTDGVSTRAQVTETSGRGVGFSAVLAACNRVKAKLVIDSEPGHGTRVRVTFPPVERVVASPSAEA
jgi:two-component system chemotaxis sensor kinase CheA